MLPDLLRFHRRTWHDASVRLIVFGNAVFAFAYGLSLVISPQQFSAFNSYAPIASLLSAEAWAAVAWTSALLSFLWPSFPRWGKLAALAFASAIWLTNATTIYFGAGFFNSGTATYGCLCLFTMLAFVRQSREVS